MHRATCAVPVTMHVYYPLNDVCASPLGWEILMAAYCPVSLLEFQFNDMTCVTSLLVLHAMIYRGLRQAQGNQAAGSWDIFLGAHGCQVASAHTATPAFMTGIT